MSYLKIFVYLLAYFFFLKGVFMLINLHKEEKRRGHLVHRRTVSEIDNKFKFKDSMYLLEFYNISFEKYMNYRLYILYLCLAVTMFNIILEQIIDLKFIYICCVFYILTQPKENLGIVPTITSVVLKKLRPRFEKDIDAEVYNLVTWLNNIALCGSNDLVNPVYIIERSLECTDRIRPVLQVVLQRWQLGNVDSAVDFFKSRLSTDYSIKFCALLAKLDELDIQDFIKQLNTLQLIYKESQLSKQHREMEVTSVKIYIPVMASAMLILVNFVFITMVTMALDALKSF